MFLARDVEKKVCGKSYDLLAKQLEQGINRGVAKIVLHSQYKSDTLNQAELSIVRAKTYFPVNIFMLVVRNTKIRTRLGNECLIFFYRVVIRMMPTMGVLPGEIWCPKDCMSEETNDVTDDLARRERAVSRLINEKKKAEEKAHSINVRVHRRSTPQI